VEVTPLTNRAFRARRGLSGGLTLLLMGVLVMVGLSACGAPAYNYVADSSAGTYYKVPSGWHQISQSDLNAYEQKSGLPPARIWSTAFDADSSPTVNHDASAALSQPFVLAEVYTLSPTASNELSYNMLRDSWLPVTSAGRQAEAQQGFPGTNFKQLRDQTITAGQGVHGVRETFQYTFAGGLTDTFDEEVLTNADQTAVYLIQLHCTTSCYTQNQNSIDTVMSSFTVGSPT
jgi:hypothetical protein